MKERFLYSFVSCEIVYLYVNQRLVHGESVLLSLIIVQRVMYLGHIGNRHYIAMF